MVELLAKHEYGYGFYVFRRATLWKLYVQQLNREYRHIDRRPPR